MYHKCLYSRIEPPKLLFFLLYRRKFYEEELDFEMLDVKVI